MSRPLADIDRDIGKATSQFRGAIADLARLDRERQAITDAGELQPTTRRRLRWYFRT